MGKNSDKKSNTFRKPDLAAVKRVKNLHCEKSKVTSSTSRENKPDLLSMALFHALKCNLHHTVLMKLVELGANLNYSNVDQKNSLHLVVGQSWDDEIYWPIILSMSNLSPFFLNAVDSYGNTALHLCITRTHNNSPKMTQYLLAAGIDKSIKNNKGETALMLAKTTKNRHPHAEFLARSPNGSIPTNRVVDRSAMSNNHEKQLSSDPTNNLKLIESVRLNKPNLVQILLHHGSDTDSRDASGRTALHIASEAGLVDIVEMLVSPKNVNLQDACLNTPLHVCQNHPNASLLTHLLLSAGANVDAQNDKGETSLMKAVEKMNITAMIKLVNKEASSDVVDKNGNSAISIFKAMGFSNIFLYLSKPTLKSDLSIDPIVKAMECFDLDILIMLLTSGQFNPSASLSVLLQANSGLFVNLSKDQKKECVELLLKHGADINKGKLDDYGSEKLAPLLVALESGDADLLKLLIARVPYSNISQAHQHRYLKAIRSIVRNGHFDVISVILPVIGKVTPRLKGDKNKYIIDLQPSMKKALQKGDIQSIAQMLTMSKEFDVFTMFNEFLHFRNPQTNSLTDNEFKILTLIVETGQYKEASNLYDNLLLKIVQIGDNRMLDLLMMNQKFACFKTSSFYSEAVITSAKKNFPEMLDMLQGRLKQLVTSDNYNCWLEKAFALALRHGSIDCVNKILPVIEGFELLPAIDQFLNFRLESSPSVLTEKEMELVDRLVEIGALKPGSIHNHSVLDVALKLKDYKLFYFLLDKIPLHHLGSSEILSEVAETAAKDNFCGCLDIVAPLLTGEMNATCASHLNNALILALERNHIEFALGVIKLFPGFDLKKAIDCVVHAGNLPLFEMVISTVSPKLVCSFIYNLPGTDWLCKASISDCFEMVEVLLKLGAPTNFQANIKQPLMYSKSVKLSEILIEYGANVNKRCSEGSVLSLAASDSNFDKVELLINHGAVVDLTALNYVLKSDQCQGKTCQTMLSLFEIDMIPHKLEESYPLAIAAGKADLITVKTLVEKGANVNYPKNENTSELSPLLEALKAKAKDVVCFLLNHGANVDKTNKDDLQASPLHYSYMQDYFEGFQTLVDAGADINEMITNRDETHSILSDILIEVHLQEQFEDAKYAILLLEKGAKIIMSDKNYDYMCASVIQICIQRGLLQLASALMHSGFLSPALPYCIDQHSRFRRVLSPFCTSLLCNMPSVAEDMLNAFYLTLSDLLILPNHKLIRHRLSESPKCLDLLDRIGGSSPPSLKMLSFVHVSDRLCNVRYRDEEDIEEDLSKGLKRRENVAKLGLLPNLQKLLLFTAADQRIAAGCADVVMSGEKSALAKYDGYHSEEEDYINSEQCRRDENSEYSSDNLDESYHSDSSSMDDQLHFVKPWKNYYMKSMMG